MNNNYSVEMININKVFNETFFANKNVSLSVKKGSIHGLIGENGAGKTVLMSILLGLYSPTSGVIKIKGYTSYVDDVAKAKQLGIGMVQQHYQLVELYRVWQNITVGDEITNHLGFVNKKATLKKLKGLCQKYHLTINLKAKMKDLSVSGHQKCEILKLLYKDVDILIFDEPTSILSQLETAHLLTMIKALRDVGKSIIFISHKISEVTGLCDEITVMRGGENVAHYNVKDVTPEQLNIDMFGQKTTVALKRTVKKKIDKILRIENLTVKKLDNPRLLGLESFNLTVHKGEIVGIAGISDNGQRELYEAIVGGTKVSEGNIYLNDINLNKSSIGERNRMGISKVPENRNEAGLILDLNVINNVCLPLINQKPFSNNGFINVSYNEAYTRDIIKKYNVVGALRGFAVMRWMSGGNQQKIVFGRESEKNHDLIILAQPSRGLDKNSIAFIHNQMLKSREADKAVLLISYDLDEIMEVTDRIIIISDGRQVGEFITKQTNIKEVGEKISLMNLQVEYKQKAEE